MRIPCQGKVNPFIVFFNQGKDRSPISCKGSRRLDSRKPEISLVAGSHGSLPDALKDCIVAHGSLLRSAEGKIHGILPGNVVRLPGSWSNS